MNSVDSPSSSTAAFLLRTPVENLPTPGQQPQQQMSSSSVDQELQRHALSSQPSNPLHPSQTRQQPSQQMQKPLATWRTDSKSVTPPTVYGSEFATGRIGGDFQAERNTTTAALKGERENGNHIGLTGRKNPRSINCAVDATKGSGLWAICPTVRSVLFQQIRAASINTTLITTNGIQGHDCYQRHLHFMKRHAMKLILDLPSEDTSEPSRNMSKTFARWMAFAAAASAVYVVAPKSNPYWSQWETLFNENRYHTSVQHWCGLGIRDKRR